MSEVSYIKVTCACGKSMKAPATAVGRKARCPACGGVIVVTDAPAPTVRPVSVAAPSRASAAGARAAPKVQVQAPRAQPVVETAPAADDFDALYEAARQAEVAPALPDVQRCPHCGLAMPEGAVLCTNCGYDTRTGRKLTTATAGPPQLPSVAAGAKKGKKPLDYMAPVGSFALGMALSLAFAVAASILWIVIAYAVDVTIGYIAILIGAAAGIGMQAGQKGHSRTGGRAAAAVTLVAILLAKLIVLELLLSRVNSHASISDLDPAKVGYYFFSPMGLLIMAIGMGAAYRTANGSITG